MPGEEAATGQGAPDPAAVERRWVASYPPGVPGSYSYPDVGLTRFLDDAARDFPDLIGVEFLGHTLTYRAVVDQVDRLATALRGLGVRRGDRVALLLPNCPQHVVALFATLRLAAVAVEIDHRVTAAMLEARINDAGCSVVVCLDAVYGRLAALKGRLPTVAHILSTGFQEYLPFPRNVLRSRGDRLPTRVLEAEGVVEFKALIRRTAPAIAQAPIEADDLGVIHYVGDRGIMLTHRNLVASAFQARLWIPDIQAGRERSLCLLPFSHPCGLTLGLSVGVLAASTLILLPRADGSGLLREIHRRKPTLLAGTQGVFELLATARGSDRHDLSSLRVCLSSSGPLPPDVSRAVEAATGGKVRGGYGVAEAGALTHANPVYGKAKPGTVGLPITDTAMVLLGADDPGSPATRGRRGELAVAGPQVMAGYWNRPQDTDAVLRDGWLRTGSIAQADEEGYVTLVGRRAGSLVADRDEDALDGILVRGKD